MDEKIDEILELTRKNNSMLRTMRRAMIWGHVLRVIYWIVIVGVSIGLFYFLNPYVRLMRQVYDQFGSQFSNVSRFIEQVGGTSTDTPQ